MLGDKKFDLLCLLTLLFFCLIKKIYELLVKKNKTTQVVLFLQLGVAFIILFTFKLTIFSLICLLMLVFFSHIVIVDSIEYLIPYSSIIGLLVIGAINLFIPNYLNISVLNRIISFIVFVILWLILSFIQKKMQKDFLGGGDLMLFCVVSLLLGGYITMFGIFLASIMALVVQIFKKDKNKLFPFGPYLVSGFIIALIISNYLF